MKVWLFFTPVDSHFLFDCCLLGIYLYKMVNLSFTFTLPCVISPWHSMTVQAPQSMLRRRLPQLIPHMPLPYQLYAQCKRLCLCHGTLGVKCLNILLPLNVEIPLHCGMTCSYRNHPVSRLKDWWKPSWSTRDKMPLTSFKVPSL